MFAKIRRTDFPPKDKPMMVWDGKCGFCKYWITNWKSNTKDRIEYSTYQEVASRYPDIPLKEFKKASRLIEMDGSVFSGPDSAFRSFLYFEKEDSKWHRWYSQKKWFQSLCDYGYNFIAKHRPQTFKVTKILFGRNPARLKHYWILYLLIILLAFYFLLKYL